MGFKIPKLLSEYLSQTEYRKPIGTFVNNGTYYSGLSSYWITYMQQIVRPCIAYSTHAVDGVSNSSLSTGTGLAILNGATRIVRGEKWFFEGNDLACRFLSDVWSPWANFDVFLERSIRFMLAGGTAPIKLDIDGHGRASLSTTRIDRSILSTDESGNITEAVFFVSLLSSLKNEQGNSDDWWLVEHRKYNDEGLPVVVYKVFRKSGIATAPTLPNPFIRGYAFNGCSGDVKRELRKMGITDLNIEYVLPFTDGLGVWQLVRTASNSCVPEAFLGDPLLYGMLDLLWSMDVVFSGSITDVILGKGKILVPKQFLSQIMQQLKQANPGATWYTTTAELDEFGDDDSFVYVQPSGFDKNKDTPTPVQFDIRAEQYKAMWELYQREASVRAGFSPTSLFPHLADDSVKTATEVTAEENLTRASVQSLHNLIVPVYNRAIREICRLNNYSDNVSLKLSDYIGNPIQRDKNIRENLMAGVIPHEKAVQQVNNISDKETQEFLEKIEQDKEKESQRQNTSGFFNEQDYFGDRVNGNANSEILTE